MTTPSFGTSIVTSSSDINTTLLTTPSAIVNRIGHSLSRDFSIFAGSCFIIIIVTSLLCNVVLVSTIIVVKKLHSVTHVFIINLAVSDLVTVLGTIPFDVEFMFRGYFPHGEISCGVMQITFLISLPSSVLNLTLLTAERFLTVVSPFKRVHYLTPINVTIAVISSWSYTLLVAFFPLMYDKDALIIFNGMCLLSRPLAYDIFQLVANFFLPIIFICYANIMLFRISRRHISNIRKHTVVLGTFTTEDIFAQELARKARKKRSSLIENQNLKAAKRIVLLVGVFLFCWLTYIVLVTSNIFCGICHPRELTWFGNIINYSASAVNPLLYGWLNKAIRHEVIRKFKQHLFGKGKNHSPLQDKIFCRSSSMKQKISHERQAFAESVKRGCDFKRKALLTVLNKKSDEKKNNAVNL